MAPPYPSPHPQLILLLSQRERFKPVWNTQSVVIFKFLNVSKQVLLQQSKYLCRHKIILSYAFFFPIFRDVKQKMEDQRREEEQAQGAVKKKRKFKNPFKRRPKTREEKIEAWLEN